MARFSRRRPEWCASAALVVGALFLCASIPSAQQAYVHLNPVIDKLSKGQMVFGTQTSDLSLTNARALARAPIDFVYIDFEHSPMNLPQLEVFLAGISDKGTVLKKGNLQPNVAVFARFAPYGREEALWVVKQALDIGLMGIMINTLETKEQALNYVKVMRYNRPKGDPLALPHGSRGDGSGIAAWFWGVPGDEYNDRADLWPLNPRGDLIFWPIIESVTGVQNADEILQVPGVSGLYLSSGGDMSRSLAVKRGDQSVDDAYLKVINACQARKAICGGTVGANDAAQWIKAGYKFLRIGTAGGGLSYQAESAIRAVRATLKQ